MSLSAEERSLTWSESETNVDHNIHLALAIELVKTLLSETSRKPPVALHQSR